MDSCKTKGLFNEQLHTNNLTAIVINSYDKVKNLELNKELQFYLLLSNIVKTGEGADFVLAKNKLRSSLKLSELSENIDLFINTLLNVVRNNSKVKLEESVLKSILESNLKVDMGLTGKYVNPVSTQEKADIPGGETDEDTEEELINFKLYIKNIYGINLGADYLRHRKLESRIFNATICDFLGDNPSGNFIETVDDLNKYIIKLKNELYKTIKDFIQSYNPDESYADTLYFQSGELSPNYRWTLKRFKNYIDSLDNLDELIQAGYFRKLRGETDSFLDALDAYTNLLYFDDELYNIVGRYVKLSNKGFKNNEVNFFYKKYLFAVDNEHKRKSWNEDGDARTAAQNTSKWSKMVLNQIPLETTLGRIKSSSVGIVNLQGAYSKLFLSVNQFSRNDSTGDLKKLRDCILNFDNNHIGNSAEITRLIAESDLIKTLLRTSGFSPTEIAVFLSMYKYVFLFLASDMQGKTFSLFSSKTLKAIQTKKRRSRINIGRYTILEDICAIIRDSVDSTYLSTQVGYDNSVKVGYRPKNKRLDGAIHKLANKINIRVLNTSSETYKLWLNECTINPISSGSYSEVEVTLNFSNPIKFTISNDKEMGILALSRKFEYTNTEKFKYLTNGINELQYINVMLFIEGVNLDPQMTQVRELIQFIDSRLGTNYLTVDGLTILQLQLQYNPDLLIDDLIPLALKAQIIAGIYSDFNNQSEINSFYKYLYTKTPFSAVVGNYSKSKNFISRVGGIYELLTTNTSNFIETYVLAQSVLMELDINSVSKNVEGNNNANVSTAYLGAKIHQINEENRSLKESGELCATNSLLFTDNGQAIKLHVIDEDLRVGGIKKVTKNAKVKELLYHSIFHGFFDQSEGIVIQPTTYSDKTKYVQYVISTTHLFELRDGTKVNLNKMSNEQVKQLYFDTIGGFVKILYNNIHNKLCTLLGLDENATVQEINQVLHNYTEELLIALAVSNNTTLELDTEYRVLKDANGNEYCEFNELLDYQANYLYSDENNFKAKLEKEKLNFINDLKSSGINFYIGYKNTNWNDVVAWIRSDAPNKSSVAKAIALRYKSSLDIKEYIENWTRNGKLLITNDSGKLNPLLEEYFYKYSLLSNNIRLSLTGSEIGHPDKSGIRNSLINTLLNVDPIISEQFKQGEITFADLIRSENAEIKSATLNALNIIENIAQGTQLKRNVVIPGTMHYILPGDLTGIGYSIKVAVIKDIKAPVWNYINDLSKVDAHDGSALVCSLLSRLENNSLGSQEVGADKKPLWHAYTHSTGTAQELKFATFEITNQRIRDAMGSKVNLLNIVKKMYNLLWNGDWVANGGLLGNNRLNASITRKLTWSDLTGGKKVYYENEYGEYIEITDFGQDENGNYYTKERKVDVTGFPEDVSKTVYHFFDINGNHYTEYADGLHTINSIYELWQTLGGAYSMEKGSDEALTYSEFSNDLLVNFVNNVVIRKPDGDIYDQTQKSYHQPLKDFFIGYVSNNTAFKNGAKNRNSSSKWYNDDKFFYFEMDSRNLGIQMDASHDIEESKLTEFSQVLTALEAGGRLHSRSKLTYKDLLKVARVTASLELESVAKIIASEIEGSDLSQVKSELYDFVGNLLIENLRDNNNGLANEILNKISKRFNINRNHLKDPIKIPFSDPNIHSLILSTYVSNLNNKSIKRKYPGSGFVMVPAYDIILYYKLPNSDGTYRKLKFDDILEEAREAGFSSNIVGNRRLDTVKQYLNSLKNSRKLVSQTSFVPSDIVDIVATDGSEITIELSDLKIYNAFENKDWNYLLNKKIINESQYNSLINSEVYEFYENITVPRNLAPSRITWKYKDDSGTELSMNLFLLPELQQGKIQTQLDNIAKGFFTKDGKSYLIYDLVNEPAEMIISNGYSSIYGLEGKSLSEIEKEGPEAFAIIPPEPVKSNNWDIAFGKGNGELTYITFDKRRAENNQQQTKIPWKKTRVIKSDNGALNVWYVSDDNVPLFKVGRLVVNDKIEYVPESYNSNGTLKKKAQFISKRTKTEVSNTDGLSVGENGEVYEYIEFITKYNRVEPQIKNGKVVNSTIYDSYSINISALNRVFISSGNEKLDESNKSNLVRSILDDIYASSNHSTLHINTVLSGFVPSIIRSSVKGMKNLPDYYKTDLLNPVINAIDEQKLDLNQEVVNLSSINMDKIQENLYAKLKNERYACWKQSLIYTAARIPALSLQSFMLMQAIAYTGNSLNVVHVSHFQTYLQGSDYDIDKAYIMGLEIDKSGLIVKYSDIMDFSTPELVLASLKLPTPSNLTITVTEGGEDITDDLLLIRNSEGANKLLNIGNALIHINNIYDKNPELDKFGNGIAKISYDLLRIPPAVVNLILTDYLVKHERTQIAPTKLQQAYKVAIAANIGNIVLDIRNADLSYRPVIMDDLHDVADTSEKGEKIKNMSLMNPATIFNMQVLNMVGKKVIGIAAVGEKVFFNLSYYWNEIIRNGNPNKLNNLTFQKVFNRIQDRYLYKNGLGDIKSVTKKALSNVNFEGNEHLIIEFSSDDLINQAKAEATLQFVKNPNLTEELKEEIVRNILNKYFKDQKETDLMISQVLSAATDNAKELILAKINCDENLAKFYIYLLIMGFDIKDIVSFMTSPVVETIAYFTESNMFDVFNPEMSLKKAVDLMSGRIDSSNFISGTIYTEDPDTGERYLIDKSDSVKNYIKGLLYRSGVESEVLDSIKDLDDAVEIYIQERLNGNVDLKTLFDDGHKDYQYLVFADYVESVITKLQETYSKYSNSNEFNLDLEEFKNIQEGADETSSLGNVFLGMNQGLPTDKAGLLSKIKKISDLIKTRENKFGLKFFAIQYLDEDTSDEKKSKLLDSMVEVLQNNNPNLKNIRETLINSIDLINNFDIQKWLYNIDNYRNRISDYYNLIKVQWNVFDMVNSIPQYSEILELLKSEYVVDKHISQRSELINRINDDIIKRFNFIDESTTKGVSDYVRDLLIINFFEDNIFEFPVKANWKIFNEYVEDIPLTSDTNINLSTVQGRASFKRVIEEYLIPALQNKDYSFINLDEIQYVENNPFIKALSVDLDVQSNTYLTLDIDMLNLKGTPTTMLKYQLYMIGLNDLSNVHINGLSLQDWLCLYNLITNQNTYGSDKLTKIFSLIVSFANSSIYNKYYKYIGDLDYLHTEKLLEKLGYDLQDVLLRLAKTTYSLPKDSDRELCYKYVDEDGKVQYFIKGKREYYPVSIYPQRNPNSSSDFDIIQQVKSNYLKHWTMPMKKKTTSSAIYQGLLSKDYKDIMNALSLCMLYGQVIIYPTNCD